MPRAAHLQHAAARGPVGVQHHDLQRVEEALSECADAVREGSSDMFERLSVVGVRLKCAPDRWMELESVIATARACKNADTRRDRIGTRRTTRPLQMSSSTKTT